MKKKDLQTFKDKKIEELTKIVQEKRVEISKAAAEMYAGKEKNLKKAKNAKRELAQMLTILRQKELRGENEETEVSSRKNTIK